MNSYSNHSPNPLLTIVTIVLNDPIGLRRTRSSLQAQSERNFQWIVVDGGSAPPTKDVLEKIDTGGEALIFREVDKGPYDGMNKGAKEAVSDWILFLNSGDELCDSNTILQIRPFLSDPDTSILYGNYERIALDGNATIKPARELSVLRYSMPFCHQSVLTRRQTVWSRPFEQSIAADWRFFNDCFYGGVRFRKAELCIARFHAGGMSGKYWIASWLDRVRHLKARDRLSVAIALFLALNLCKHLCSQASGIVKTTLNGIWIKAQGVVDANRS